jgi:hypothetical protein
VTLKVCCSALLLSVTSANSIGKAPPSPRPVKARARANSCTSRAKAVSRENSPKTKIELTSTRLRPMLSARRPPSNAPMNNPNVLALKKVPN